MPGTDFMKRERRRGWSKRDDGAVRGRNSAPNPNMEDSTMTDLAPLQHPSLRNPTFRPNAVTGEQKIISFLGLTRFETPVEPGFEFVADMLSRKIGYGRTGENTFDFRLEYVGFPPPPPPEDPDFKPATSWTWAVLSELIEHTTNGTIARGAVIEVWEAYKRSPEGAAGMMPVIRIGSPREVQCGANGRTFYAPNFQIVGWIARDDVPAFRDRLAMCPLPSPTPERLAYTPIAPQLAPPPAKRSGRAPAPVRDTPRDDINDAIPF
jgi:hypothetical protein